MKSNFSITFEQNKNDVQITAYGRSEKGVIKMNVSEYFLNSISLNDLINTFRKKDVFDLNKEKKESSILIDSKKEGSAKKIVIPDKGGILYILVDEIVCFEADRSYTYIHLKNGKKYVVSNRSLGEWENMLIGCNFFRAHRSFLINMDHIEKYHCNGSIKLEMKQGHNIPVSRRKRADFEKVMENHVVMIPQELKKVS